MMSLPDRLDPGLPYPLGATYDGLGVNFAVFSGNATQIELCIFDEKGRREVRRFPLPECTDEVWHGYLPDAGPGLVYGYRAHGPYDPKRGHRFNAQKLLIDPYARKLLGSVKWSDALFGYRVQHPKADLSFDRRDSAPLVPKCIVTDTRVKATEIPPPRRSWSETLIYEAHVRGLTMMREDIRPDLRGTSAALADPRVIDHLLKIGVTAIELLPVHAYLQDHFLHERGLRNYWGYNTLCFFAPEPSYLRTGMNNDLRMAIRRLRNAGIEVLLDVVYNHTCEGNELGPTLSWKGLDNASYYRLMPGEERYYINDTGCGNTVNLSHPRVLQMVMDSLRHWAESYGVDGFRFDLGVTLGREGTGFDPGSGFFDAILQDPVLSRLKLISEPWDIGPGGYQLGNHPPAFAEWNAQFRDSTRRFWAGHEGMRGEAAAVLMGSPQLFDSRHRRPWASVNFLTSHDGFTARDLVTYAEKHNEANGDDNSDGHGENYSNNWGQEGPVEDPVINETRERVLRSMLATVFFAHGTPMLLAGDEFGNSQMGNNNAYCQDNEISWLDWGEAATPEGEALTIFVARLAALRRAHASLRFERYLDGNQEVAPGISRVAWFDLNGEHMAPEAWDYGPGRVLGLRRVAEAPSGGLDVTLVVMNAGEDDVSFELPSPAMSWTLKLDTAASNEEEFASPTDTLQVRAHSLMLLTAVHQPEVNHD